MVDQSSLYSGYQGASRYAGIKDADIRKPLGRYHISLDWMRKLRPSATTDQQLRRMAGRAVVKRYLLAKSGKAKPKNYITLSIPELKDYIGGK